MGGPRTSTSPMDAYLKKPAPLDVNTRDLIANYGKAQPMRIAGGSPKPKPTMRIAGGPQRKTASEIADKVLQKIIKQRV